MSADDTGMFIHLTGAGARDVHTLSVYQNAWEALALPGTRVRAEKVESIPLDKYPGLENSGLTTLYEVTAVGVKYAPAPPLHPQDPNPSP